MKEPRYIPNSIPAEIRNTNIILSLVLFSYCTWGVVTGTIWIPGKRGGMELHGASMWMVYAAMVLGVVNLLSVVVDHYDQRDNEISYRRIAFFTQTAAWGLFAIAVIVRLFFA